MLERIKEDAGRSLTNFTDRDHSQRTYYWIVLAGLAINALSWFAAILNPHVIVSTKTGGLLLPFEQNIGPRDMFAESAVNNRSFANVADRQKQEIYEALVMTAGITFYFYEEPRKKNDAEYLKNSKLLAERNLKMIGIDP